MKRRWNNIPESEIYRLDKTLSIHLRKMNVKLSKKDRIEKIKKILTKQKFTCAFGDGDGSYCWNHPRNKDLKYLKLEWGHKIPAFHGESSQEETNLILLCARCNNHIQSSQKIDDLITELEHKVKALKKIQSR